MKGKYFLDTNILIYSFDETAPLKQKRARQLITQAIESKKGVISYQVVQEFLNIALKTAQLRLSLDAAQSYFQKVLKPLCEIHSSDELYLIAFSVQSKMKVSWYDSLIIAAAIMSEAEFLYTEDLQESRKIEGVTIKNPFSR